MLDYDQKYFLSSLIYEVFQQQEEAREEKWSK